MLVTATPRDWFDFASRDLHALLSDHLHCERKEAENALGLVRRCPHAHGQAVAPSSTTYRRAREYISLSARPTSEGGHRP